MPAKCIAYLFRSLHAKEVKGRKCDYITQFRVESALMHDFFIFEQKRDFVMRILTSGLNIASEYSKTDILKMCFPKSGPFLKFFTFLQEMRELSHMGNRPKWGWNR